MLTDRKSILVALVFLLPIIIILPVITGFPRILGSEYSDLDITHYPNTLLIQNSLLKDGEIPLWNRFILNGYPFDGDPLSGLWYPPGWIALLLPLPFGINLTVLLHILAGGVGMWFYLSAKGYMLVLRAAGAGMVMLMPEIYSHFGAGHVTFLYAITLTPWLLFACTLSYQKKFPILTMVMGLIILADIRWFPYACIILISEMTSQRILKRKFDRRDFGLFAGSLIIGLMTAAVLLIPMGLFTSVSTRILMTSTDILDYSLPPLRLAGLLLPLIGGAEWTIYVGGIILAFSISSISLMKTDKELLPWLIGLLAMTIWAMGENIPGLKLVASLPGINLTRVPARAMIVVMFCLFILSLHVQKKMLGANIPLTLKVIKLSLFGISITLFAAAGFTIYLESSNYISTTIGALIALISLFFMIIYDKRSIGPNQLSIVICVLMLASLVIFDTSFLRVSSIKDTSSSPSLQQFLIKNSGNKVYSPSFTVSQAQAIENNIILVNGISPLQLRDYVKFLAKATGVNADRYSVIQPLIGTDDPAKSNQEALLDVDYLNSLGVRSVVSSFQINNSRLIKDQEYSGFYAYTVKNNGLIPGIRGAIITEFSIYALKVAANKMTYLVNSENGGLLRTGENYFPGWRIRIDNKNAKVIPSDGIFRDVEVPPGEHLIEFTYRPNSTYIGIFISLLTITSLITFFVSGQNENP